MSNCLLFTFVIICVGKSNVSGKSALKNDIVESTSINFSNGSVVSETQHTICSIRTEEVVARAQSTASRILTGVCTTEDMTKAFENVERKLAEQFEKLQQNLITLIQSKFLRAEEKLQKLQIVGNQSNRLHLG
ncbi:uncharacterized protein LOC131668974 isoform X1 [Phymastichus coffea]|uniref:uncharacterized protein LOC131668974 isoform X1 n=1 Tax=Phymastichus coffea TaxID=108790 RepID=UPI00273CA621|nr:uncharacterized protein LOC131668974 isoform X1 [Phymastichus coffea]